MPEQHDDRDDKADADNARSSLSLPPIYTNFHDRRNQSNTALPRPAAPPFPDSSSDSPTMNYAYPPAPSSADPWLPRSSGVPPLRSEEPSYVRLSSGAPSAGSYRHDAYSSQSQSPQHSLGPPRWMGERRPSSGTPSHIPFSPVSASSTDDGWSPGGHFSPSYSNSQPISIPPSSASLGVLPLQHQLPSQSYHHHGVHSVPSLGPPSHHHHQHNLNVGMSAPLPLLDRTGAPQRRRGKLPKATTEYLKDWLHKHAEHPYPSEDEKKRLCAATGLSMSQVSNWMINARRRILAPNKANASPATTTTPFQAAPTRPTSSDSNSSHSGSTRTLTAPARPSLISTVSSSSRTSSVSNDGFHAPITSPSSRSASISVPSAVGPSGYSMPYPYHSHPSDSSGIPQSGYDVAGGGGGGRSASGSAGAGGSPVGSATSGDGGDSGSAGPH